MFEYSIVTQDNHAATINFKGDIDIESTEKIEEDLIQWVQPYKDVILDFSEVQFVDSTGIGLLMHFILQLKEMTEQVRIQNLRPDVEEVFMLLQLPSIVGEECFIPSK